MPCLIACRLLPGELCSVQHRAVAVAGLHGNPALYRLLVRIAGTWKVSSVFLAGDLVPGGTGPPRESPFVVLFTSDGGKQVDASEAERGNIR